MSRLSFPSFLASTIVLLAVVGAHESASAHEAAAGKAPELNTTAGRQSATLAAAIKAFNAKSRESDLGKQQSPLTEEEVVAAILLSERSEYSSAPAKLFEAFREIARTRKLPTGAEFEVLTGIDPGEDFIYDVWYVRIMLPKDDGGTYSFTIRNRIIRARPVGEVAKELEDALKKIPPMPGRYRLEDRLKEMKERAAKAAKPTS